MGIETTALLLGAAATPAVAAGGASIAATAATAGLFGAGGAFSLGTTLATLGTALGAVGAITSMGGRAAASDYSSVIAAQNAQIAKQQADLAGAAGDQQVAMQQAKTRATVGAIKAAQAASGIDVNTGSAVDVRSSAAELGQLDAISIRSNAARTAYGYQTQSASDLAQSQLDRFEAKNDRTAGYLNAGTSVLGGVSKALQLTGDL